MADTGLQAKTIGGSCAGKPAQKRAFITGITGQDGSLLAELLLDRGYEVHGLVRRSSTQEGSNLGNLRTIHQHLTLHKGDILDPHCLIRILGAVRPREIYHLAAQSHVTLSFEIPDYTLQVNVQGTLNLLQAIILCGMEREVRLYNAASSELFGGNEANDSMLNELSSFFPKSPYAISKLAAYWLVRNYRDAHQLFAVNGILFNHESSRRSGRFVTKRIARGVAKYVLGLAEKPLTLAGVEVCRDWGHAKDYVLGMWLMLQQREPRDIVLATGTKTSVRDFVEMAFKQVNVLIRWQGLGAELKGIDTTKGDVIVEIDPNLTRPVDVDCLVGDSSLARELLGWVPSHSLQDIAEEMVAYEIDRLTKLRESGGTL